MKKLGKYIVIEGQDGTGKSTQVDIIRAKLAERGIQSIDFHEPAGSPMADEIRTLLKNGNIPRDPISDVLLFTAARRDIWTSCALPALENGLWVVTSRSYFSTIAYQGYGDCIDQDYIYEITKMTMDDRYISPDYVCVLTLKNENERKKRIGKRGELEVPDNFESKNQAYQDRVSGGYLKLAKKHKSRIISADGTPEEINNKIWNDIQQL